MGCDDEVNVEGGEEVPELGEVDFLSVEETCTRCSKGNGTVHRTCVNVFITSIGGKGFCHGAFATGGVSVDGYYDFFHYFYWFVFSG